MLGLLLGCVFSAMAASSPDIMPGNNSNENLRIIVELEDESVIAQLARKACL
jgi:hypothetical protein